MSDFCWQTILDFPQHLRMTHMSAQWEDNKRCRGYHLNPLLIQACFFCQKRCERQTFSGQLSSYIHSGVNFQMSSLAGMSIRVSSLGMQASHRKWRKFCCSLTFVPHKLVSHRRDEIWHDCRDRRS